MVEAIDRLVAGLQRLGYYASGIARHAVPTGWYSRWRDEIMAGLDNSPDVDLLFERANYYNRLTPGTLPLPQVPLSKIDRSKSRYFLDFDEYLRFFPRDLCVDYIYGDVTTVPDEASIVKSRPVGGDNQNSVLLNLDKFRHFRTFRDGISWDQKIPKVVWRGSLNNPLRRALVARHADSPFADVGHVGEVKEGLSPRPFLSPADQLSFRYILSIEGFDVATNLKWIMASGSVCLMPKSRFETWFMEGRLKPGHHFVAVRDDFADLEEKIDILESSPDLAAEIVRNANAYFASFRDRRIERLVSLLVLQKYFEATDQLAPGPLSHRFFA